MYQVGIRGEKRNVSSWGMCLGTIRISLCPFFHSFYIKDEEEKNMLMKFTDDIKLGGDANSIRPAKQYKGTQRA